MPDLKILMPYIMSAFIIIVVFTALLPLIADFFSANSNSKTYTFNQLDAGAVIQDGQINNTGIIERFIIALGSDTVTNAQLCYQSSQTLQSGIYFNVSRITNNTWPSTIDNMAQNTTLPRDNSLNVSVTASGSSACFNVTNQIKAGSSGTYLSLEILNTNRSFDYSKVGATYNGITQTPWITNTTAVASLSTNQTLFGSPVLTVTSTYQYGVISSLEFLIPLFIAILVVFVIWKGYKTKNF